MWIILLIVGVFLWGFLVNQNNNIDKKLNTIITSITNIEEELSILNIKIENVENQVIELAEKIEQEKLLTMNEFNQLINPLENS